MVLPPEEVGDVLTSGKMTPSVQFQDRMSSFQGEGNFWLDLCTTKCTPLALKVHYPIPCTLYPVFVCF